MIRGFSAAVAGLLAAGAAAAADAPLRTPPQCFLDQNYRGFRAVNDHEMIVQVNIHDYYRIELEGSCPKLMRPNAVLITRVHGPDVICGPRDWELRVAETGEQRYADGCIVKRQTPLTPAEAAALPPEQRP